MKSVLLIIACVVLGASCNRSQTLLTEETSQQELINKKDMYDFLSSTWALESYSGYFVSGLPIDSLPKYGGDKVVYKIDLRNFELSVIKNIKPHQRDYSLPEGKYRIWANDCMVKIGEEFYTYDVIPIETNNGDTHRLVLDSNYDPSYGADALVYNFTRI